MKRRREFQIPTEPPARMQRTTPFACIPFEYVLTAGVCARRQKNPAFDGEQAPGCSLKGPDGITVCAQGRKVLVALGEVKRAPAKHARPMKSARELLVARFNPNVLPDVTRPEPPPQPPAKPPDDFAEKMRKLAEVSAKKLEDVDEDPPRKAPRTVRSNPAWRARHGTRMHDIHARKRAHLMPQRDQWCEQGRVGDPPAGICSTHGCSSLLRRDSAGAQCSKCLTRHRQVVDRTARMAARLDVALLPDDFLRRCAEELARRG